MRLSKERLFVLKQLTVTNGKGVTWNHCWGFLVMYYQEILGKPGYLYIYTFIHFATWNKYYRKKKKKKKYYKDCKFTGQEEPQKSSKLKCNIVWLNFCNTVLVEGWGSPIEAKKLEVPSRGLRQTTLKAWPYLLKLVPPLSKRHQEPLCNKNPKRLILFKYGK